MKKINIIKSIAEIGILGGITVPLSTALTSCGEKANLVFNSPTDVENYVNSHNNIERGPPDSLDSNDLIQWFLKDGHLTNQNILSCYFLFAFENDKIAQTWNTPLQFKINIDGEISYKMVKDFKGVSSDGRDTVQVIYYKNSYQKIIISTSSLTVQTYQKTLQKIDDDNKHTYEVFQKEVFNFLTTSASIQQNYEKTDLILDLNNEDNEYFTIYLPKTLYPDIILPS